MKKKIIFWAIVAVLIIGIGLFLKFSAFGTTIMSIVIGVVGVVVGWIAKTLYNRYVVE